MRIIQTHKRLWKKNEWPSIDSSVMLAINFMMVRLRAAVAFSEDVSSALVAKIVAGVAWVPDHVGDLQPLMLKIGQRSTLMTMGMICNP